MKNNSKLKKIIIAVSGIIIIAAACAGMLIIYNNNKDDPEEGLKSIIVQVISERDNYSFEEKYKTDEEYLGNFLDKEGLIEYDESDYGRFITSVQGYKADYNVDKSYWSVYIDGEYAQTGIDQTVIKDGALYKLELASE